MHEGINPDKESGAILTPIVQSTTFIQDSVEKYLVSERNGRGTSPFGHNERFSEGWKLHPFVAWIACFFMFLLLHDRTEYSPPNRHYGRHQSMMMRMHAKNESVSEGPGIRTRRRTPQ